ncbi:hypothetical protein EPA93_16325 [Ktedonosporobacter rubrisoli]|uniref:Uncharacterized protein n=1 Tax=Ktedonosporobacter rubrisoli TaxID=2509675 RepID=A0A4P6JQM0_KTERU|nr:hypothetical protein [Ktedonosporobacter rubrisoli]QBD77470.1 hypothetical protein EPA93_16325 [Ktedonosporobacter rubrisoli]
MAIRSDLLLDVQQAYKVGKAGNGNPYNEDRPGLLERVHQWNYGFQPQEQLVKDLCVDLLRSTIAAIRQGELTNAEGFIRAMRSIIANSSLSKNNQAVCHSYIAAAVAYLDYKRQRYEDAMEHLQEALAIDERLEQTDPIYRYMHLHRMMLLDNWVRVLARQRSAFEAMDLAFHVLDYLERKIPTLPLPTIWDSSLLAAYPADILSIFFRTIASQIAEAATGQSSISAPDGMMQLRDIFVHACHHSSPAASSTCYLSPASHDWIQLKIAALEDNISVFLQHSIRLLSAGPGRVPTLWYATIVEIILLSQRLPSSNAAFREELMQEVLTWQRLPPAWKTAIWKIA